jgi:hypothetical protein
MSNILYPRGKFVYYTNTVLWAVAVVLGAIVAFVAGFSR